MALVESLARQGRTVLFITHDMEVAARYAHRIAVLDRGRVMTQGNAREVLHSERLAMAGLVPPPVVQLAARLGVPACWWGEVLACRV